MTREYAARAQVKTLVEALRFYADENGWRNANMGSYAIDMDAGDCARAALTQAGLGPEDTP